MLSNTSLSMQIGFSPSQTTKVISKAILQTLIYKQNDSTGNFFPLPGYRVGILSFNFANSLLVKATTKVNDFNKMQLARSRSRSKTITTSFSG